MDTTEEYVQMCVQAKELQALKESVIAWTKGDYGLTVFNRVKVYCGKDVLSPEELKGWRWIPRFDQLAALYFSISTGQTATAVLEILQELTIMQAGERRETLERLMICFVMKELYNKRWFGPLLGWQDK